ncbi:MAG: hypothetical protein JWO54_357 [Candidatus Saccharibacteria bacterium]|nr:hypothetical protein [Candidatus Saccharibacteria bacterium]
MTYRTNAPLPGRPPSGWEGYIKHSEDDEKKLRKVFFSDLADPFKRTSQINFDSMPLIYLYYETTDELGNYSIDTIYGGGGHSSATRGVSAERNIIYDKSKYIGKDTRGKVLDAFCEIEFLIDILVCIDFGVYEGLKSYKWVKRLYSWESKSEQKLPDTSSRIKLLMSSDLITEKTYNSLMSAKKIRNILAHQFIPEFYKGELAKEMQGYQNVGEAIYEIYNTAWFNLLEDYNKSQYKVIDWFTKEIFK